MCSGSSDAAPAALPPAAPQNDLLDVPAQLARDREVFRIHAAQGMKANFVTGLRGLEGKPQALNDGRNQPLVQPMNPSRPTSTTPREFQQPHAVVPVGGSGSFTTPPPDAFGSLLGAPAPASPAPARFSPTPTSTPASAAPPPAQRSQGAAGSRPAATSSPGAGWVWNPQTSQWMYVGGGSA